MEKIFTVLGWFVLASLSLAIARQLSEQKHVWNEGFMVLNPADANLTKDPYALLESIPVKPGASESKTGNLTASTCYETDYIAQNQRTGNFDQLTNNFKHVRPDSCSAPFTEIVNTIYREIPN